jgi:small-conductance mechanosensitive channel
MSAPTLIDPRGPRFAATLTSVLLTVALVLAPSPATLVLLAVQALLFGYAVAVGVQRTPYAWLFRRFVRPRLAPPGTLEDATAPRFAQGVGLAFALVALFGYAVGADLAGATAAGLALAAAYLNAAFGFCLGCELHVLLRRFLPARLLAGSGVLEARNS